MLFIVNDAALDLFLSHCAEVSGWSLQLLASLALNELQKFVTISVLVLDVELCDYMTSTVVTDTLHNKTKC